MGSGSELRDSIKGSQDHYSDQRIRKLFLEKYVHCLQNQKSIMQPMSQAYYEKKKKHAMVKEGTLNLVK
jgi:hypothetical protein